MFAFSSATHCSEARRFGPTSFCLTFTPAMKDGEPIQIGLSFPLVFEFD
jgi:hypothetical protein